jgi:hypothetical protein
MQRKVLLPPLVVTFFFVVCVLLSYRGLIAQKMAIEDIFSSRFRGYQNSTTVIGDMGRIHANLYKMLSWVSAGYKKGQIEELAKGQIAAIDKTSSLMRKMVDDKATDQDSKAQYQLALTRLAEYRTVASQVAAEAVTNNAAATRAMLAAESKFQVVMNALQDLMQHEYVLSEKSYRAAMTGANSVSRVS